MGAENGAPETPSINLGPIKDLIKSVRNRIDEVLDTLNQVADRIAEGIRTVLEALLPAIGEALAGSLSAFTGLVEGLLTNLATVDDIGGGLAALIAQRSAGAAQWLSEVAVAGGPGIVAGLARPILDSVSQATTDRILGILGHVPIEPGGTTLAGLLDGMGETIKRLALVAALIMTAPIAAGAALGPELEEVAQDNWLRKPVRVATPEQAFDAAARGVIGWDVAAELARRAGLRPDQVNIVAASAQHRVGVAEIIALEVRGLLSREEADTALRRAGVPEWATWRLLQAAQTPIGPSDVASLAGREAFEPDQVRDLQLDAELPPVYLQVARQAGLPEEAARWYWYAHWQPMPLSYAYEALHREFITPDQLDAVFRQQEVLPWVRDALKGISYDPLTRVDVRRAFGLGILTPEQVHKAYTDLGYDTTNAAILVDFTVSQKAAADEADRVQRTAPIRSRVVEAYRDATISRTEAEDTLALLGDAVEDTAVLLAGADVDRARRRADSVRDALQPLYVNGFLDEPAIRGRLHDAGIDGTEAEYLLSGWRIRREFRELTEAERAQRDLTKSEVIASYKGRLLAEADARSLLFNLGYDETEQSALLSLADYQLAGQIRTQRERTVRAKFLGGRINEQEARNELSKIPLPVERIQLLAEQWTVERDERTPDIALSALEELVRERLAPWDQVDEELARRGYTQGERQLLRALWEQRVMVAERRIALAERALEQRERLQAQRLEAAERLQTARLAVGLEREQSRLAAQTQRDARRAEADAARLERSITAADAQLTRKLDAQAAIEGRRADLQARRLEAQTTAQTRSIEAQVARLERQIAARREESDLARAERERLTLLRDQLRREAEGRAETRRVALEQRGVLRDIGREERAYARKLTTSALALEQERVLADARAQALAQIQQQLQATLRQSLEAAGASLARILGGAAV